MQGKTLWEGDECPLCKSQGFNSKLKFYRLNLREAALLCKRKKCPFPLSTNYPDVFVLVGRDGNIIPGSQSERGLSPEEAAYESDDSPDISDASEESFTFPYIDPEVEPLKKFSSENTNEKDPLEVDAFDINSIDFETDDSLDIFKLQNEITSLEMEITKSVGNMKCELPHVNCKDCSLLNKNSEKCVNSGSVAATASTSADDKAGTDTNKELDINSTNYVKMNENGVNWCNYRKSGDIILHEHDSPTGKLRSLEVIKISEELGNCVQQSDVDTPVSNKCILNHNHADVQNNSSRNFRGGGCTDDGNYGNGLENVKSIINGNCSDSNVENQLDMFTLAEPKPILLIPQDTKNAKENDLSGACELCAELATNESVTFIKDNICENEMCDNKEVVIFDDHKNSDCSYNNVRKQLDTKPEADPSNPEPKPSVLLITEGMKSTIGNGLPRKQELCADLVRNESVTIEKDNDCGKEKDGITKIVIISDELHNTDSSNHIAEKQLDTIPKTDTSNPSPERSLLLTPQSMKSIVVNDLPRKRELPTELVGSESVPIKRANDCGEKCDNTEIDIIFKGDDDSEVYEIVTIESDTLSTVSLNDSRNYEVINLKLRVCDNQKSSRGKAGRKTTKLHHRVQNTVEQHCKRSSGVCSDSEVVTPSLKLKVIEEDGLFRCTTDNSEGETKITGHSKNCVCFLCSESNTKGITSHLDRALADLFPEECSTEKYLSERELPTEKEVMRDLVQYMTGNSNLPKNIKRSPRKRNRLLHLL